MTNDDLPFEVNVAREYVAVFREKLTERVPDPSKTQLIRTDFSYTMEELSSLLQLLGAHLSTLTALVGELEADNYVMGEGYKSIMAIALGKYSGEATQVSAKQGDILAQDSRLQRVKFNEIQTAACLTLAKAWRKSYEDAYTTVSRIGSFDMSEAALQTARHN